jgi:hypothetical protein
VQGAAADNVAVWVFGDNKLLDSLKQHHQFFTEQNAPVNKRLNQRPNRSNVRRCCLANLCTGGVFCHPIRLVGATSRIRPQPLPPVQHRPDGWW